MIRRTQFALAAAAAGMALLACSIEIPSLKFGPDIQIAEPGEVEVGSTQTESTASPPPATGRAWIWNSAEGRSE